MLRAAALKSLAVLREVEGFFALLMRRYRKASTYVFYVYVRMLRKRGGSQASSLRPLFQGYMRECMLADILVAGTLRSKDSFVFEILTKED